MRTNRTKPLLIKAAFPSALSLVGIFLSMMMARRGRRDEDQRRSRSSEDERRPLSPSQSSDSSETLQDSQGVEIGYGPEEVFSGIQSQLTLLQDREREMEERLLHYVGLKERECAIKETQNALELEIARVESLGLKVEFLEIECRRMAEYVRIVELLEAARSEVGILTRKMKTLQARNRLGFRAFRRQAALRQALEAKWAEEAKEFEETIAGLREKIDRLEKEKLELIDQLEIPEISAESTPKGEANAGKGHYNRARAVEEELQSQIEELQKDRLVNLEELIHLRWVNACLRYELWRNQEQQEQQQQQEESSDGDLTVKHPNPECEEQAKKAECGATDYDSGAHAALDMGETALEAAGDRRPCKRKPVLFRRLKKWVQRKDGCKKTDPLSDIEDHCLCPGRMSLSDGCREDPASNSC